METALLRFSKYVAYEPMSGCWLWSGGYAGNGYPHFSYQGKSYKASRFSYQAHKGTLKTSEVVRHQCHNPSCVNPFHLEKGTQKDNILDSSRAGRLNIKLTDNAVREILSLYKPHVVSLNVLASKFKVAKKNILNIVKGKIYKHIYSEFKIAQGEQA